MKGTPEFKKTKTVTDSFKRPDGTDHFLHGLVAERSGADVTHELFVRLAGAIVANRRPELGRSGPEQ
jgi:hypothetical protein